MQWTYPPSPLFPSSQAKAETNGMELDGRRIRVDYSITSHAHSPTPGRYMGRPTRWGLVSRDHHVACIAS